MDEPKSDLCPHCGPGYRYGDAGCSHRPFDEYVWLGALSGFTIVAGTEADEPYVYVEHRCGWSEQLPDGLVYVANLVDPEGPIAAHRKEGCQ